MIRRYSSRPEGQSDVLIYTAKKDGTPQKYAKDHGIHVNRLVSVVACGIMQGDVAALIHYGEITTGRPKKNGTYLNICIETSIYERLEAICEDAGQTKTVAVERTL